MNTPLPEDEDARLRLLFSAAATPIEDDGFSGRVASHIARESRRRRLLLGGASAVALAVAGPVLWQAAGLAGAGVSLLSSATSLALSASRLAFGSLEDPVVLSACALLALAPGLLRWLED